MAKETRATQALKQAGIAYTVHPYDYDPGAEHRGLQAADALGEPPDRVLKTLMALVDGRAVCVIVPSHREVSMKRLASAVGGKSAQMMPIEAAERISGYVVGGISPFGQKRPSPVIIEELALRHDHVFINAGQRGVLVRVSPMQAVDVLRATVASLVAS